jgi:hypothetical protein
MKIPAAMAAMMWLFLGVAGYATMRVPAARGTSASGSGDVARAAAKDAASLGLVRDLCADGLDSDVTAIDVPLNPLSI